MKLYIWVILMLTFGHLFAQDDHNVFYRKELIIRPTISSNGYGLSFSSIKKQTLKRFSYWKISLSEIKHRKEIKGVNPNYPSQREFVFGKINHLYPINFTYGRHRKIILKNNPKAIGLRFFYGLGAEIGILKPVYYQIELVYSQDSSRVFWDQFNPDYHNVNNIRDRSSWFMGLNNINITPGISVEVGSLVDFSKRKGRIHGVSLSALFHTFVLPAEILAGEPGRRLYFGFNIGYNWGWVVNYLTPTGDVPKHNGWGMLKKY